MYESYFGFREKPFSLVPDPSFLYLGRTHATALSMLEYGLLNDAAIVVVSGEIGSGKTTLIRHILEKFSKDVTVGLISNTHKAFGALIQWVSLAFGLPYEGKEKVALYGSFVDFLIKEYTKGKRTVLIVDEAQNMDADTLEELRVISNINADKNLVLQLILVGQPELRETLRRPSLEQFAQRVSVDYHLRALDLTESVEYIRHRQVLAGGTGTVIESEAAALIYEYSGGVPRLINSLCETSLIYAFAEKKRSVNATLVSEIVSERREHGLLGAGKLSYPEGQAVRGSNAPNSIGPKQ